MQPESRREPRRATVRRVARSHGSADVHHVTRRPAPRAAARVAAAPRPCRNTRRTARSTFRRGRRSDGRSRAAALQAAPRSRSWLRGATTTLPRCASPLPPDAHPRPEMHRVHARRDCRPTESRSQFRPRSIRAADQSLASLALVTIGAGGKLVKAAREC